MLTLICINASLYAIIIYIFSCVWSSEQHLHFRRFVVLFNFVFAVCFGALEFPSPSFLFLLCQQFAAGHDEAHKFDVCGIFPAGHHHRFAVGIRDWEWENHCPSQLVGCICCFWCVSYVSYVGISAPAVRARLTFWPLWQWQSVPNTDSQAINHGQSEWRACLKAIQLRIRTRTRIRFQLNLNAVRVPKLITRQLKRYNQKSRTKINGIPNDSVLELSP